MKATRYGGLDPIKLVSVKADLQSVIGLYTIIKSVIGYIPARVPKLVMSPISHFA